MAPATATARRALFLAAASVACAQSPSATATSTLSGTPATTPTSTPLNLTSTLISVPPTGYLRTAAVLSAPAGGAATFAYFNFVSTVNRGFRVTVVALSGPIATGGGLSSIAPNGMTFTPNNPFASAATSAVATVYAYDPTYTGQGQQWWIKLGTTGTLSYNLTIMYIDTPTPLPTPGTLLPLALNSMQSVDQLPLGARELYVFNAPVSSMPLGFTINLQPSISPPTDADLFFSTLVPVGTALTSQLSSQLGAGALDSVTVTPASPYWLPAGGPYYIQTLAYTACAYTLTVVPVPATPSPAPYVPAAAPAPGTVSILSLPMTPGAQSTLPVGGRACFSARADLNFGSLGVTADVIDPTTAGAWAPGTYGNPMAMTAAANVALTAYLSWPIAADTVVLAGGDSSLPSSARTLSLTAASLGGWWVGLSGDYLFCVSNAGTAPVMYRVTLNAPPTPVPMPTPGPPTVTAVSNGVPVVTASVPAGSWTFYSYAPQTNDTVSFSVSPSQLDRSALAAVRLFGSAGNPDVWTASRAAFINSGSLQLTSSLNERGYGFIGDMVRVLPSISFSFDFKVFPSPATHGEGFCWVIHTDPRGAAAQGGVGASMGVGPDPPVPASVAGAISNSISVCFRNNAAGNGLPFSTFVVVNGNMTCAQTPAAQSGCAHPVPDFVAATDTWTVSIETDAPSNTIWWDMRNTLTGDTVGSFVQYVPNLASVLRFSEFAWLGFAAGTSAAWDTFTISNYAWSARDRVLGSTVGGDASVYVGVQAPTRSDEWSGYLRHSNTPGQTTDYVNVTTTAPFFIPGPSTTPYYAGVYCTGPAACGYSFGVRVSLTPSLSPTPTPSKSNGATPSTTRSPVPTHSPTAAATPSPLAVNMLQQLTWVQAQSAASVPLAYLAPLSSTYYEYPVPTGDTFTVYLTPLGPTPGVGVTAAVILEVSRSRPTCARAFVNVSDDVSVNQCSWNADLLLTAVDPSGMKYVVVSPNSPEFPAIGRSLFVRVRNIAPNAGGAIAGVNVAVYSLAVKQPDSGPSGAAAGIGSGVIVGAIIGGVVLVLLLAAMGFFTLVTLKKMSGRAQVITVMTTAKPQVEAAPAAYGSPPPPPPPGAAGGGSSLTRAPSSRASVSHVVGNPMVSPVPRSAFPPGSV